MVKIMRYSELVPPCSPAFNLESLSFSFRLIYFRFLCGLTAEESGVDFMVSSKATKGLVMGVGELSTPTKAAGGGWTFFPSGWAAVPRRGVKEGSRRGNGKTGGPVGTTTVVLFMVRNAVLVSVWMVLCTAASRQCQYSSGWDVVKVEAVGSLPAEDLDRKDETVAARSAQFTTVLTFSHFVNGDDLKTEKQAISSGLVCACRAIKAVSTGGSPSSVWPPLRSE